MDLLFLRNKRRQRQSDGPAMTAFIYDAHIELFKAKWLRRSQSRSKVAQGLCQSLCSLALKKSDLKNLPFVLSLEAFPIKRHLLLLLGKMDKNVWTGFYFIFIKFRKEKETALRQTKNKRQCHEQDVKIHYSTHLTPSCFERQRMKEWEIDGIGMGCETVRKRKKERKKEKEMDEIWFMIAARSFLGFFLRRSRHRDRSPVDWWMITQSGRSPRQRQFPPHMAIAQMDLSCGWPWSSTGWRIRHGPDCRYSHRTTRSRGSANERAEEPKRNLFRHTRADVTCPSTLIFIYFILFVYFFFLSFVFASPGRSTAPSTNSS
jgi:hypothetical protein